MFIEPMGSADFIKSFEGIGKTPEQSESGSLFKDIFENAINNVTETENAYVESEYLLATGQIEDAHTVPINAAKAQLAVDLLIQLRNKALESYNELIKINL